MLSSMLLPIYKKLSNINGVQNRISTNIWLVKYMGLWHWHDNGPQVKSLICYCELPHNTVKSGDTLLINHRNWLLFTPKQFELLVTSCISGYRPGHFLGCQVAIALKHMDFWRETIQRRTWIVWLLSLRWVILCRLSPLAIGQVTSLMMSPPVGLLYLWVWVCFLRCGYLSISLYSYSGCRVLVLVMVDQLIWLKLASPVRGVENAVCYFLPSEWGVPLPSLLSSS